MTDVTEAKQKYDPWTDSDPDPERTEAWFDDPANVWYSIHVPPNTSIFVVVPEGISADERDRRKAAALARDERRRAEEEKDWSPEQKATREAERVTAEEAFAMRDRGEIPTGSAVTWHRGGDLLEGPTREALEREQD